MAAIRIQTKLRMIRRRKEFVKVRKSVIGVQNAYRRACTTGVPPTRPRGTAVLLLHSCCCCTAAATAQLLLPHSTTW